MGRIGTVVVAALVATPAIAGAQGKSPISVALTPYLGLVVPGRDLLLRPGLSVERDPESQAVFGTVGGRVTIDFTAKLAVEADVGVGASGLKVSTLSAPSGTDASVTTISGRLLYRTRPTSEPSWITIHAGVASVGRSFTESSGTVSAIKDGSSFGLVVGGTIGFRTTARTALTVTAEDYLYNASFDVTRAGGTSQRSQSLTQNDFRVTIGLRLQLFGG